MEEAICPVVVVYRVPVDVTVTKRARFTVLAVRNAQVERCDMPIRGLLSLVVSVLMDMMYCGSCVMMRVVRLCACCIRSKEQSDYGYARCQ